MRLMLIIEVSTYVEAVAQGSPNEDELWVSLEMSERLLSSHWSKVCQAAFRTPY